MIPRVGRSLTEFGMTILRHLELMAVPTVMSSTALQVARNKFMTIQALWAARISKPLTSMVGSKSELDKAVRLMDYPVVVKVLSGTQGVGVMKIERKEEARSVIDALSATGENLCVQEFVGSGGEDIRAFVVGDEVVASMRRIAPPHEWRSNIHRGARGEPYDLSAEERDIALSATRATGLEIAGIDMLETDRGALVLEVNASPGFQGLLRATGVDASKSIVEYAVKKAKIMRSAREVKLQTRAESYERALP